MRARRLGDSEGARQGTRGADAEMHNLPWPGGGEGMHQARLHSIYTCTLCATEEELTLSTWVVSASKPNSAPTMRGVHQGCSEHKSEVSTQKQNALPSTAC